MRGNRNATGWSDRDEVESNAGLDGLLSMRLSCICSVRAGLRERVRAEHDMADEARSQSATNASARPAADGLDVDTVRTVVGAPMGRRAGRTRGRLCSAMVRAAAGSYRPQQGSRLSLNKPAAAFVDVYATRVRVHCAWCARA